MDRLPVVTHVLFVCVHNAGRSQMSQALFNRARGGAHEARSAGSAPAARVHREVIAVMDEVGVDLRGEVPKPLTRELAEWADVVVTMGCGDACPYIPGKRYLDWDLEDPKGQTLDAVRGTRDEIARRIEGLLAELGPDETDSKPTPSPLSHPHRGGCSPSTSDRVSSSEPARQARTTYDRAAMYTTQTLLRRGLALEYATLGWNVVGTAILIAAAVAASSVALAGFGVDSLIEIIASTVVVWQLKGGQGSKRERRALRIIAAAFLALAIYIAAQSALTLASHAHPKRSTLGIAWLAATTVAMFALAAGKRDIGIRLDNRVLRTEARVTLIDGALAAAVLTGLVLNAVIGWWWADPLAALVILIYGVREARQAWTDANAS